MNVVIPPIFFYVIGAMLVVFGALRALTLGRRSRRSLVDVDADGNENPARASERRRHLRFGIIWVLMGLFLIISTAGVLKVRSPF